MRMQGYCDLYKWTILKRTSPEVKCLHPTSSRRKMCTSSVSNVIYHKFSHGAAFYTLSRKNVNVTLELSIFLSHPDSSTERSKLRNKNNYLRIILKIWPYLALCQVSKYMYSRTSMAQTLMAHLPRLFRTRS